MFLLANMLLMMLRCRGIADITVTIFNILVLHINIIHFVDYKDGNYISFGGVMS